MFQTALGRGLGEACASPTRILLVEDERLLGTLVQEVILHLFPSAECHLAHTIEESLAYLDKNSPTVILLDLGLPDGDGWEFAHRCSAPGSRKRLLVISGRVDDATMLEASRAPIAGFVDKSGTSPEGLKQAILAVAAGGTYFSPGIIVAMTRVRQDPDLWTKLLSTAEMAIMPALLDGWDDAEIAVTLGRGRETIRSQRRSIMKKLGLTSTVELILWGAERGLKRFLSILNPAQLSSGEAPRQAWNAGNRN